jgi:D-2-hydroxyacid dehydrogenase (NADP+)
MGSFEVVLWRGPAQFRYIKRMTNLLILLTLPEPIRGQYRDRLRARFPELNIALVDHHSKVGPHIGQADALLTFAPMLSDHVLQSATRLKWVQALGTGVDNLIDRPCLRKDVIVTNVHGIHGPPVSEAAIAAMLALARNLPRAIRLQEKRQWARFPAQLLHNKTVGIFGIGAIAEALAPKCKVFGMRVIGVSSAPREVPGFDRMHDSAELAALAGEFDFFVLLTPLTEKTRNSVGAEIFAAMKATSFLINLARGGVVDEAALLDALRGGRIAGAALDVFNEEPLPADHPFWSMDNVIITTHQGGFCDVYIDHAWPTLEANMRRFLNGDIGGMINVVPH